MIELKNINIRFHKKECIRNGNFKAYPYQITGIYGESGTGKSSLLYIIGMLSDQQHDYYYNDEFLKLDDKQKDKFRKEHISFITQNSLLIDTISVEKNIEFYLMQSNIEYTVDELLEKVKLRDKKKAMPNSLSGGERQRVAIACAIAMDSDIILGDELTSALDEENKKIIMKILRECANQGKTVILVSHERNIINECDRVYRLDHLELALEKDSNQIKITKKHIENKKVKFLKMFDLLFYSNKKYNRRRILMSLLVMLILFLGVSIIVEGYHSKDNSDFSINDVKNTKLLVLSDESGFYHNTQFGIAIRSIIKFDPISPDSIAKLNNVDNIKKSYDYYVFSNGIDKNGNNMNMSLTAKRDGKDIEEIESSNELMIDDSDLKYSVVPFYKEENSFKQDLGVYINEYMAYISHLKEGDTLELELNIPFVLAKSLTPTVDENGNRTDHYPVEAICDNLKYKTKVTGIIKGNSQQSEMYMNYDIMKNMIDEKVQMYKSGKIRLDETYLKSYYEIIDLQPYAKSIFVNKQENVLGVQNEINKISNKIYAYSEYQSVLGLIDEDKKLANQSFKIACLGGAIFIIGGAVIEIFNIKKYKSTYMMMNLTGYDKKEKNKVFILHSIYQIMIIMCSSMIIYVTASLPEILVSFNIMKYEDVVKYINEIYNYYMAYCGFSMMHFMIFIVLVILVVGTVNICMKKHYDKQDLITWLRER